MSAEELRLAVAAHCEAQTRALERTDLLAWLIGSYVAAGVHAPRRYPRRPCGVRARKVMTDEEMKRAALAIAARHVGGEENGHDA